jgi:hypothetical protein
VHPNDWITMHPAAAWRNSPDCTSCHREQSFCIGCHRRVGVALSSPSAVRFGGRFHPPRAAWTEPPRGAGHHSFEAQRNARACVGCHAEQDCVVCHGASGSVLGGGRYSPHPAAFFQDCNRLMNRNPRPCRVCHGDLTAVQASDFCR